ncbi:MAG TPA: hypothetical protein DGH68_07170 [Bacteroidetes bacterium]|jgi:hypothetical protein|nr:hypothetical protein [Bacteroidota bacterium]
MEAIVQHSSHDEQDRLVREYCKEVEALIALARSRTDATRIKDAHCHKFRQECKSKLIVNAAAKYLEQAIERKWGADGTDRAHDNH